LNDPVTMSLRASLDLRYRRHELLANNIANADTRDYQPTDLEFEGALQEELGKDFGPLARTEAQHLGAGPVESALENTVQRPDVTDSLDGNGVDTDKEMARVAENSLQFKATLEVLRRRYGIVRQAVSDMSRT